jgi:hypothetical protein
MVKKLDTFIWMKKQITPGCREFRILKGVNRV